MAVYRERIEQALASLLGAGFKVIDLIEAPEAFGNTRITIASSRLMARFTSDRGQLFVDVASPTQKDQWYDLSEVLTDAKFVEEAGPWVSAHAAVAALERHHLLLSERIANPAFMGNLHARA